MFASRTVFDAFSFYWQNNSDETLNWVSQIYFLFGFKQKLITFLWLNSQEHSFF